VSEHVQAYSARTTGPAALFGRLASLVRYRFFLYAGLLPYLLGAAWSWAVLGVFDAGLFWTGLGGILLSVVGVEAFNEYFDSRMGTDRVFDPEDTPAMSHAVLWLGVAAFACALAVGLYLAWLTGWPILLYAGLGGLAAAFYVAPPIRFAYRGLGETVIALSYGPLMVLGSLHLHAHSLVTDQGPGADQSLGAGVIAPALLASLVPGLMIMALAVTNAIPDFHQDRLVGKRNLVVRLGRQRAVWLYNGLAALALLVVVLGVVLGAFPWPTLAALAAAPLVGQSLHRARDTWKTPRAFLPAVRAIVRGYLVATVLFTLGLLSQPWLAG
jgi:1,4-dihydroxy-2-naphthoate octaprenyltransferase